MLRQQCHDLRSDKEPLIASVALLNEKLQQHQAQATKDSVFARDYKDLQEDNVRTQKMLEAAQTLSQEARAQQVKLEEKLREEKDSREHIQSQLSILQEEVRRLENEAQELEKINELLEERQRERQVEHVEHERATLQERVVVLEMEVLTLSGALESEELTRAECQMRLQLALEEMDVYKKMENGSKATVAKHCDAARHHCEVTVNVSA